MTTFAGHFLGPDTHTNRPAVTGLPNGTQYFCTTHSKVERIVSGAWADYYSTGTTETLPVTIFDAKGDVLVGSAADAGAALAVGTNGQVLTADSAQTLGVKWATPSAGAAGALTLLSTTTLASAGTFDVSSISGAYNDLILVLIGRTAGSGGGENVNLTLNNDSAANYLRENFTLNGSSFVGEESSGAAVIRVGTVPTSSAAAGWFGVNEVTVYGYASTTWRKVVQWNSWYAFDMSNGDKTLHRGGGLWNSTAAVTRVILAGQSGNFAIGSQLRIYGRL